MPENTPEKLPDMRRRRRHLLIPAAIGGCLLILCSFASGLAGAYLGGRLLGGTGLVTSQNVTSPIRITDEQSATIQVSANSSPSVVSIIISKDLPTYQNYYYDPLTNTYTQPDSNATQKTAIGAGSGFIISSDGLVLTNRHVASDTTASYTVIFTDGTQLDAKVLARDTVLDIAILKITTDKQLKPLDLGDSDSLKIGQNVIAIGNALGEFSNTVSSGIISGLNRSIVASDASSGGSEQLDNLIQTDASINSGNSGGPLLDIDGKVIGVNVAIAQDAQNIGFAIPINTVKKIIDSVNKYGEIRRPYLGVRYQMVTDTIQKNNNLSIDYGALIVAGSSSSQPAIIKDGPSDKAGLKVGDVIEEINNQKIELPDHTLQTEVQKYDVGDQITVKYLRAGQENTVTVTLEQQPTQ